MLETIKNNFFKADNFYLENVEKFKNVRSDKTFADTETIKPINILHDEDILSNVNMNFDDGKKNNIIYYISDLHLDHKIVKKFPKSVSKRKIVEFIKKIVREMVKQLPNGLFFNDYLLILGDISHSFEISKIFYTELANIQSIWAENIIVILGNHELWEDGNIDISLNKYKELFTNLKITFLNNELLCVKGKGLGGTFYKLTEEEINNYSEEKIKEMCIDSKITILGGIGFSGLNPKYNADFGLYKSTIKSLEEDKKLSLQFEKIYLKLKQALYDSELIIVTHNPKNDWSMDNYQNNWVYVNGHTHRNEYYKNDEKVVYADNQIGYYNNNITLKHFFTSKKYDIFKYYSDGIYEISINNYIDFVFGMGIKMEYNRNDGVINMLKKDGIYCFILKADNNRLYLLNGGKRHRLNKNEINYYYENMSYYATRIKESTNKYSNYLKEISNYVKSFGGYGSIHGCIVDIDFFNHLYVNPYDGQITPYYALSIVDKYVYKDLGRLLSAKCPQLYENYKMINKNNKNMVIKNNSNIKIYDFEHYKDTSLYNESRIMKALQYLINDNIIRIWNDNLIEGKENLENLLIESQK